MKSVATIFIIYYDTPCAMSREPSNLDGTYEVGYRALLTGYVRDIYRKPM